MIENKTPGIILVINVAGEWDYVGGKMVVEDQVGRPVGGDAGGGAGGAHDIKRGLE